MVIPVSSFILAVSFIGILGIVLPKLSRLRELPKDDWGLREVISDATDTLANSEKLQPLKPEKLLQKALSKTRVLALKTDNKTSAWLENLRERSKEKEGRFKDAYWSQLREGKKSQKEEK
ncbi:MAG: hypothetical protein KJI69_01680 [Patescibacteria group bacterium]|nr:hypothetical protein [Patescibacteria group bacterium]